MIEGIDIFKPYDGGLPDISKIPVASIFNGSVAASVEAMRARSVPSVFEPFGGQDTQNDPTIPTVVKSQKKSYVEHVLSGGLAKDRKSIYGKSRYSGGYSVVEPTLPGGSSSIPDQPLGGGDVTGELPSGSSTDSPQGGTLLLPVDGPPPPDSQPSQQVDLPSLWSSVSNAVLSELKNLKLIN